MTTAEVQAKHAYVLTLTERDVKNAFANARRQAYLDQIRLNETTAYRGWADAVQTMREIVWQDSKETGTTAPYVSRGNSWRPPLSLDNVKFAFYRNIARK